METGKNIFSIKTTFILALLLVVIINLIYLKDFWGYGVIGEDWQFLLNFKTDHNVGNIFLKIFEFWTQSRAHWGTQISYLGVFDLLFPSNYMIIQIFNMLGKIVATILIFPVIYTLTKNKLVAFLSTIFFAVHYSSAGSLYQYANGVEYWAIFFLILFILNYKEIIISNNYKPLKLFVSLILLYLALSLGLYRLNGFIIIMFIVEGILFLKRKTSLKNSFTRITTFIILPIIIVWYAHHPTEGRENLPITFLNHILSGNWFIFINPLAGLALTFIPRTFLGGSELAILQSFKMYSIYIIKSFILPSSLIILVLGYILPLKTRRFILVSGIVFIILILLLFLLISHNNNYPRYDIIPASIVGAFIVSLSISLGLEWKLSQQNNLILFTSFITPLISLFFTTVTWILNINNDTSITYDQGIHRYLMVPAIGTSIFAASLVTMTVKRKFNSQFQRVISNSFILVLIVFLFYTSYKELQIFKFAKEEGLNLKYQIASQEFFYNTYIRNKGDIILYYIASPQKLIDRKIERALAPDFMSWLVYLRQYYLKGPNNEGLGCIMNLAFTWHQKEAIIQQDNGEFVFYYPAKCPIDKSKAGKTIYAENRWITLTIDKLFAFTIQGGEIQDITEYVKEKIQQGISPEEIAKTITNISALQL